ncbi:MAG: magnesium chelatase ATPase subunit I, partial [Candidatus Methanomethylophilus sp.]|nr:magnesium chelatase ATPase subunit I [Methanomethylophilus sp.]
ELQAMRDRIVKAKSLMPQVTAGNKAVDMVVSVMVHFGVDGHRADITMLKAAKANAALEGHTAVTKDDLRAVAELVLAHRLKRRPFEEAGLDQEELEKCLRSL